MLLAGDPLEVGQQSGVLVAGLARWLASPVQLARLARSTWG
jgi:hypothetical protein